MVLYLLPAIVFGGSQSTLKQDNGHRQDSPTREFQLGAILYRIPRLNQFSVIQPVFKPPPLGSIKPLGWFKDQLELEALGLAGNMFDFFRYVNDSKWIGGSSEYSILDEASPYWFNGLVPLAFGLGDARLKSQVKYYLDYVLDHQQSDGWLGFETTPQSRGIWARCLLLLGMMVREPIFHYYNPYFAFKSPKGSSVSPPALGSNL